MKKIALFLILFLTASAAFAQAVVSSSNIICYNLTRDEMIEFNQNSEQYKESIREILAANGASFLSFIVQSGDTFLVNMIGLSVEKDVVFLYDVDKKTLKILYTSPAGFNEKIISNVEIMRSDSAIKLNKLNKFSAFFVIQFADDIFGELGIRQPLGI